MQKKKLSNSLTRNYFWALREYPYKDVEKKIIAEKYFCEKDGSQLKDYKLFCFGGIVKYIQVDIDRFKEHKRNIYDTKWNYIPLSIEYPTDSNIKIECPSCIEKMIQIAEILSENILHVRVDFYVVNDKPLIGEMTFFHGSGYEKFVPEELNEVWGELIQLPILE